MNTVLSQEQAQKLHYAEVRKRLYAQAPQPKPANVNEKLQASYADVEAENKQLKRKLTAMEDTIADLQARVLDQAHRLCVLQDIGADEPDEKKPVPEIIKEVLVDFPGITWRDIIGVRRARRLIEPRHLCIAEVHRQRPDLSLPQIGRLFGNRDHTTILSAIRKIETRSNEPSGESR